MRCVKETVESLSEQDDQETATALLKEKMISRFDPLSILFSIALSWAIQQLIKWINNQIHDRNYGDIG